MRYNINIPQQKCIENNLNASEAHLMSLFESLSTWAQYVVIDGLVYYHLSRNKVLEELPLFFFTADTVYRNLKKLDEKGVIIYKKKGKMDLVSLTEKGKKIFGDYEILKNKVVKKPKKKALQNSDSNPKNNKIRNEIRVNSDLNPKNKKHDFQHLQCLAYKNSDSNPTYNNNNTINNSLGDFLEQFKTENPVAFESLFNSFTFLENLDRSLKSYNKNLNFQADVIPVLFKWFESQFISGGLNKNVSAIKSQFVNYVTAVIKNKKQKHQEENKINPFHAKVLRNAI